MSNENSKIPEGGKFSKVSRGALQAPGKQFIHYAMTDLPMRIEYRSEPEAQP